MTIPIRPPVPGPNLVPTEIPFRPQQETASFAEVFSRLVNDTSQLQDDATDLIAAFLRGEPVELHQVMAASEEASLSLELLVQIRNKLTEAYRTVMSIQ